MIIISIGANLPGPQGEPPLQAARWAAAWLDTLPGLRLRALSRWYLSDPEPPSGQPAYVNAIAILAATATEPEPAAVLGSLHDIEARAGRVRGERNAARPLDLDIIAMGEAGATIRAAPDPILPHPRAHLRAFVLVPLLDVAPGWLHPVLGRRASDLLGELTPQGIRLLTPGAR